MASATPIRRLLVLFAMEQEATPLVSSLGLAVSATTLPSLPAKVFQGEVGSLSVTVVCNGEDPAHEGVQSIGTVAAALTTYAAAQAFQPDLILNAGTAGAFEAKGAGICDVYVASKVAFHDRRIQLPGYDRYGIGMADCVAAPALLAATGWKTGVVSTSDSLDMSPSCEKQMMENDASVKEMEAASIAYTSRLLGLPLMSIKVVTDLVDHSAGTPEQFVENLGKAAAKLASVVPVAIKHIASRTLEEL